MFSEFQKSQAQKILSMYSNVPDLEKGGQGSGRKSGFSLSVQKHLKDDSEYSKGWLHHPSRTEEADSKLENHLRDNLKLEPKEIAAYVISPHGRHTGDAYERDRNFNNLPKNSKFVLDHKRSVKNGDYDQDLQKSEGSRGGKVIGHTRSGEPIYDNHNYEDLNKKGIKKEDLEYNVQGHFLMKEHKDYHSAKDRHDNFGPVNHSNKLVYDKAQRDLADAHKKYRQALYEKLKNKPNNSLQKAEGDRGGKVVGHTKNGTPIYDHGQSRTFGVWHQPYKDEAARIGETRSKKDIHISYDSDKDFTPEDHEDAMISHAKNIARKTKEIEEGRSASPSADEYWINHHKEQIEKHSKHVKKSKDSLEKSGEGSRGGKIIGHDKNGHPIYQTAKKYPIYKNEHASKSGNGKDKYDSLRDNEKVKINGVNHKLELIKHKGEWGSHPTYSAKVTHPETGEIKVLPHAVQFHEGYDQGYASKLQYYPNVAGYGTSNGGGQSSTSKPYLNSRHIEHLANHFEDKPTYSVGEKERKESIRSYPKGTTNSKIDEDISGR